MKKDEQQQQGTGHKPEPGPTDAAAPGTHAETLPMGMLGGAPATGGKDPDQKSTHNAPKTVEATLPDGSPTYADPGTRPQAKATKRGTAGKAGRYEVVSPITTKVDDTVLRLQPGEFVELDEKEAGSLGDAVKPAK